MSKKTLFSKLHKRYSDSRSKMATSTIINGIFDLSDKNYKNISKINTYMHELKSRGSDAIYEYYVKYIKRVIDEEVEFERINVYHALNEVIKLNEAEKIWNFVNLLQDLKDEHNFALNYEKCSKAMAETGNTTFNLYWAEVYPEYNSANINAIIKTGNAELVARLVTLVENLTDAQIEVCKKIVKASKDVNIQKEVKEALKYRKSKTVV